MTYNFVSSDAMLAKLYRDFRPADGSFISDAVEWIGESLQAMDISPLHDKKKEERTTIGHRTKIPCDLRAIRGIEYKGYPLPMGKDLTGLSLSADNPRTTVFHPSGEAVNTSVFQSDGSAVPPQDPDNISWEGDNVEFVGVDTPDAGEYYMIVPGMIVTSFETGTIQIHYYAFPVNKTTGLPMVPDTYLAKEAILWYLISRMLMAGYVHPKFTFEFADDRWEQKKMEAMNDAMYPSIEDTKSFGKMWVRLIDGIHLPDQFFMNAEIGEELRVFTDDYAS